MVEGGGSGETLREEVTVSVRFSIARLLVLAVALVAAVTVPAAAQSNGPGSEESPVGFPQQLSCVEWPTAGWAEAPLPGGVDAAALAARADELLAGDNQSLVIIQGGELVFEQYDADVDSSTIFNSYSVSKSFTSTMIGKLWDDGRLRLDERAPVPEWDDPSDPRSEITLRHLLNMASGLQWDEFVDAIAMIGGGGNSASFPIARPLVAEPGTTFEYSTGTTQILARIIADEVGVAGDAYADYLDAELFGPLGMAAEPGFDPAGIWAGGYATNMSTRDFAKLGLLYLRGGVWEGEQFLSRDWVEMARTPSAANPGYGLQFWLAGEGRFQMLGLFGQVVYVAPDLDLVIASNTRDGGSGGGVGQIAELFGAAEAPSCVDEVYRFSYQGRMADGADRRYAGANVPFRYRVAGQTNRRAGFAAEVTARPVDCSTGASLGPAEAVDVAIRAMPRRQRFGFRWATDPSMVGCYDVNVQLADGVPHVTRVTLRPRR